MRVNSTKWYKSTTILNEKAIRMLSVVFGVVAKANNLVRLQDNRYKTEIGTFYYLDSLGFHTENQHSNIQLDEKEKQLNKLIAKYNKLLSEDEISNRSRQRILKMIGKKDVPYKDKLNNIKHHLNKKR